ncbi:Clavaminate synthase-like protein [Hypoxylon trugodes]|uniref:Clavaminate synthase-like protein n=1 Tax=Hypoxylon trugodes TaxID=326681 RepID=UPI0021933A56|nr:Clavaminate synthase-like protein [Hypoxylon trugodes]KAI1388001.1 Clavaminate synthase-like protein [Hypoxylon trugodes]
MAEAEFVIPTIDISPFLNDPSSAESARVVEEVRQACVTSGFFQIVNHGVPKELQDAVFKAAETFFALPLEEKKKLRPPILKNRGYELIGSQALQEGSLPDLKEGFFVGQHIPASDPRSQAHPYLIGPNIFPDSLPDAALKIPTETYYSTIFDLSCRIMGILARGLPYGNDIFVPFISGDPVCAIRLLHYPPQDSTDSRQLGAGAHTDFGAITLLLQDSAGGLEVLNPNTQSWVSVTPNPDAYVVNIGDMLSFWTRGAYRSTIHRVVNRSGKDRYSVPFFFDGNTDVELAPLDGSGGGDGVKKALTAEEHMLERYGTTYGRVGNDDTRGAAAAVAPVA